MSDCHPFLPDAKQLARIDSSDDDATLSQLLHAATGDVLEAAGRDMPDDLHGLPFDLVFAICDHAVMLFDARGSATERDRPRGLSLAASRITARYRGVALGAHESPAGGQEP